MNPSSLSGRQCGQASTPSASARLRHPRTCAVCGQPAPVTEAVDTPHGLRWLDRCMPCVLATTPCGGPPVPLADTVAVLRDAAHEAGVRLAVVTDDGVAG